MQKTKRTPKDSSKESWRLFKKDRATAKKPLQDDKTRMDYIRDYGGLMGFLALMFFSGVGLFFLFIYLLIVLVQ